MNFFIETRAYQLNRRAQVGGFEHNCWRVETSFPTLERTINKKMLFDQQQSIVYNIDDLQFSRQNGIYNTI